jgi:hypothetical protein
MFEKVFGVVNDNNPNTSGDQDRFISRFQKNPYQQGLFSAPEWTRTITGKFPHKALNQI